MSGPQIILWVIALVVLALCARRGMPQARRAVAETNRGFWRILPMFCVALPMAAFLSELVPADIATAWLGDDSGLNGIMIASLAGGIMPGGPFVTFPLVITFSKAGAGVAQMTALLTAWSVYALHRILTWEYPVLGWRFVAMRLASSFFLPVLAGLIMQALLPFFAINLAAP
jgi:uncharacterized membrane protein YraQ (UPF0718 family)